MKKYHFLFSVKGDGVMVVEWSGEERSGGLERNVEGEGEGLLKLSMG